MQKIKYKSNHNIVYSCKYHIIWCPKYRRKVLVGEVEKRLKEIIIQVANELNVIIIQVANELNVEIIEMETDKDHIHILVKHALSVYKVLRLCIKSHLIVFYGIRDNWRTNTKNT